MNYSDFTPGVDIQEDDRGSFQVVNGKKHYLSPLSMHYIIMWREAGMDDDEIVDWLERT